MGRNRKQRCRKLKVLRKRLQEASFYMCPAADGGSPIHAASIELVRGEVNLMISVLSNIIRHNEILKEAQSIEIQTGLTYFPISGTLDLSESRKNGNGDL